MLKGTPVTQQMNTRNLLFLVGWLAALSPVLAGEARALKRSDVVFMYQSDRQTYLDYGATVLAWGGKPTPKSREAAQGVKLFGSVGMVTEFGRLVSAPSTGWGVAPPPRRMRASVIRAHIEVRADILSLQISRADRAMNTRRRVRRCKERAAARGDEWAAACSEGECFSTTHVECRTG